jgi:hypothetical protein
MHRGCTPASRGSSCNGPKCCAIVATFEATACPLPKSRAGCVGHGSQPGSHFRLGPLDLSGRRLIFWACIAGCTSLATAVQSCFIASVCHKTCCTLHVPLCDKFSDSQIETSKAEPTTGYHFNETLSWKSQIGNPKFLKQPFFPQQNSLRPKSLDFRLLLPVLGTIGNRADSEDLSANVQSNLKRVRSEGIEPPTLSV